MYHSPASFWQFAVQQFHQMLAMTFSSSELDTCLQEPLAAAPAIGQLGGGTIRRDAKGQLIRATGRHTVVYELRTPSGRILVLRVHQRPDRERDRALAQRYQALQRDTLLDPLRAPQGPLPDNIQWLPEGLLVRSPEGMTVALPLVAMERVPGRTLRETVSRLCQERDTSHLALIADRWLEAALALERAGFVHGDLGPDNIMVRPDSTIAVIDLDTAKWPGFQLESGMTGSASSLRHPQGLPRSPDYLDRFPALMLWASLRILAVRPDLLPGPGDQPPQGLIFSNADVRRPAASPIFQSLEEPDAPLSLLLEVVRRAIRFSPDELPSLSEIAARLDALGFPRSAPRSSGRPASAARTTLSGPTTPREKGVASEPAHQVSASAKASQKEPAILDGRSSPTLQPDRLDALGQAIQQRNGREAIRIWAEVRETAGAQAYAAAIHQLLEQEAHAAIDRAMRRRDDDALLQAISQAENAGVAPTAAALTAARGARRRAATRDALHAALRENDQAVLINLHGSGQIAELGPLDPATNRAITRAIAWPSLERALTSDDDVAICAAADPALWREDETTPQAVWRRLDLAWQRSRWNQDVRAALRRRDGPYLRGLLAKGPAGAEDRLTEVERRRIHRVITREQAATRLERALREGPDREVVEALAELETSGAPFSEGLDWSAVRGVVDRLSLADALRAALASEPPDTERLARLLPAARAALGDLQSAGTEWAELEQAVLRAAHLERLREAIDSGDEARIAAAADPDPFLVRSILTDDDAALVTAVLGRTRTQVRRHAS